MEEYSENEIRIKRSIFWKIYFVLLICLIVWGTNESLIDENSGLIEIIEIPMVLIATIGLFGYVFFVRIVCYLLGHLFLILVLSQEHYFLQ